MVKSGEKAHTPFAAEAVCSKNGSHPILNVLTRKKQVISKEKYHHEEHEGHKVKSGYKKLRDLRVLRGRQVLYRVTGSELPAECFVVSSLRSKHSGSSTAERAGSLGFL